MKKILAVLGLTAAVSFGLTNAASATHEEGDDDFHGPYVTPTVTVTVPVTEPVVTTTTPPTTAPPTTVATTVPGGGSGSIVTTAPPTTQSQSGGPLPQTGTSVDTIIQVGALLAVGGLLVVIATRRRNASNAA
jgi:LPXTG-motif cell wall-anchored protein